MSRPRNRQSLVEILGLEDDVRARNNTFPDTTLAETAADHDAFRICPGLRLEEALRDISQLPREFFDRTMDECSRGHIVAKQDFVEAGFTDLVGSLMIRPVFIEGAGGPVTGLPEEKSIVTLYPNPNHGEFYVDRKVKVLHILSVTGPSLPFVAQEDGDQQKISIPNASSGLYVLKIQQGTSIVTKKIVVR